MKNERAALNDQCWMDMPREGVEAASRETQVAREESGEAGEQGHWGQSVARRDERQDQGGQREQRFGCSVQLSHPGHV